MAKRVAIIGGGPAGMLVAYYLAEVAEVQLFEANKALGRKFLVAGQGGFNLTNAATGAELFSKYTPPGFLAPALQAFGPDAWRDLLAVLGIPTYVGSSGRVFPERGIKPISVLNALLDALRARGVVLRMEHRFVGFVHGKPEVEHAGERRVIEADAYVLALGGASWSVTGSRGDALAALAALGVPTHPYMPSNCGIHVAWPSAVVQAHAGKPLKNIAVRQAQGWLRGEATLTRYGLEGNAIYPVVPELRAALATGEARVQLDLKPDLTRADLAERLAQGGAVDKAAGLDRPAMAILKAYTDKATYNDPDALAAAIKSLPLPVSGLRPLEEAISSAGGVDCEALAPDYSLPGHPRVHVIGEMVAWDTCTGGFLIQGCVAMGYYLAQQLARRWAGV